jgi:hypothetical protein
MTGKNPLGNGKEPQTYEGLNVIVPIGGWQLIKSPRSPTSNDKKYPVGAIWVNTATNAAYILTSAPGNWSLFGTSSGGSVNSLTGDSGGAILPSAGNITLAGTSAQGLTTSGAGSTITFTNTDWTTAQKGVGVLSTNAQAVTGTGTTQAVTPAALTARLQAPGAIGGTTPAAGSFTTVSGTTTITAGTTLTATLGDITATNGNFVGSTAGKGLMFNANTATGAAASPIVINSRAGQAIFTSVSIAAAADLTLTITNSAITASTTQVIYSMSGATTGSALSIKSVTNSSGSSAIVVTNGTGATTTTTNITLNFIVVN